jgi:hypothetical protein
MSFILCQFFNDLIQRLIAFMVLLNPYVISKESYDCSQHQFHRTAVQAGTAWRSKKQEHPP